MTSTISKLVRLCNKSLKELHTINQCRYSSSSKLLYNEYGDPTKVVMKVDDTITTDIDPNEVLIKMLASPINPADINTIQGKYPVKPKFPSVPGNEGVGEVIAVGKQVKGISNGDRVVLLGTALGTWRTHAVIPSKSLLKIPKKVGLIEAATLAVNPCTAFRMLKDFVDLKPDDSVIQNGANSSAGQNVIQVARVWGYKTVNIVRDRPNIDELKEFLKDLGATYVLTEEELRTTDLFKSGAVKRPKLGLNCVGGKSALELIRHLDHSATLVTYGGMSREPVIIPTGPLIFKDLRLRGFWMTAWNKINFESAEKKAMLDGIISMMERGDIRTPAYSLVPFNDYKEALMNTMSIKGMIGRKYILDFTDQKNIT